ncbi:hypothetical protein BDB01DRAFT_794928 [Pilobolus umbonatus]|nr:hypothetical protein BDB01DRAFT_794928 [Pilobolus umbonatus]
MKGINIINVATTMLGFSVFILLAVQANRYKRQPYLPPIYRMIREGEKASSIAALYSIYLFSGISTHSHCNTVLQ